MLVVDEWFEWDIEREVFALSAADVHQISCTWEEAVPITMEAYRHHPVRCVKSLLYSVTMMNIYIDIEYSVVIFEQL